MKTGLFGGGESFVPLRSSEVSGNDVRVPFDKDKVKDAPRISDSDGRLSEEEGHPVPVPADGCGLRLVRHD